jgi:hypothetical protein
MTITKPDHALIRRTRRARPIDEIVDLFGRNRSFVRRWVREPRADYLARSVEAAKPWVALGISRATWYRRRSADSPSFESPSAASLRSAREIAALRAPRASGGAAERQRYYLEMARAQPVSNPESHGNAKKPAKPWESAGVSRSTWYRRQKAARESRPMGDLF